MQVNLKNLDSYDMLEEILKWKRTKCKGHKVNDRVDVEINMRNLFDKINKKNGKSNKRK